MIITRPIHEPAASIWGSAWLRPLNDVDAIDDLLARVHSTWSLGRIKARVLRVVQESPDARTFVLRPNRNWPGFRAGQHVVVEVEIEGVRHQRSYSLSTAPAKSRTLAITVKRQEGGKVSNWLHDHLQTGDVVVLSPPSGDFVLPESAPARLLMLSAGSGITPLMSMLRDLHARGHAGDVVFVHACRSREEAIFGRELENLAATWPGLHLHFHFSCELGRLDVDSLSRRVPDYAERHTLLCGPQGFMATFQEHWCERRLEHELQVEHFGLPLAPLTDASDAHFAMRCERSERAWTARGDAPLLVEAERAGLRPRYGCRIGICHTCQCVKRSGTVENLLTGKVSAEPGEQIQLCITRARSDLVLDI